MLKSCVSFGSTKQKGEKGHVKMDDKAVDDFWVSDFFATFFLASDYYICLCLGDFHNCLWRLAWR